MESSGEGHHGGTTDERVARPFFKTKLCDEASKNWDIFYKNHKANFFKDRQWCDREFDVLNESFGYRNDVEKLQLLEVGCGVGNFIFPTLEKTKGLFIYGCDFSKRAIDLVKMNPKYDPARLHAFEADLTRSSTFSDHIPDQTIDIVTCLFVLSAIPPLKMEQAIATMARCLKPGGKLLFRDYALNDVAQLKFHTRPSSSYTMPSRLEAAVPWYVRGDKTLTYFFTKQELLTLMAGSTLYPDLEEHVQVIERWTTNVKLDKEMQRSFLQGQFVKQARP